MLTARKVYYGCYVAELSMLPKSASFLFARIKVDWALSHLISEKEPSASHMCARISSHTYDRQK
jgi:hypothetical protein